MHLLTVVYSIRDNINTAKKKTFPDKHWIVIFGTRLAYFTVKEREREYNIHPYRKHGQVRFHVSWSWMAVESMGFKRVLADKMIG